MTKTTPLYAFKPALIASLTMIALLGCSDDDDEIIAPPDEPITQFASLQIIHAGSDAPTVNITADGEVLNGLENVDYQTVSGRFDVATGTYDVAVEANLPGDETIEVLTQSLTLDVDMNYDIFAVGTLAQDNLGLLAVTSESTDVEAGNAQVQIVHAASLAPTVDIYVTAPGAQVADEQPLVTAAFMDFTTPAQVTAGEYQIQITAAGSTDVVFDSGPINLADGADLIVAATNSVATGESPVSLLIADGDQQALVHDASAPADIRVVHGISDAPAVDVIANNALTLVDGLAFPSATGYLSVEPDTYLIDVVADADNSVVAIDDVEVSLEQAMRYTAIANNSLAEPQLNLVTDMPRSIATAAQIRLFHASPAAGDVDIYVTTDGDIEDVSPAFAQVAYNAEMLNETGYVSLAEGDYYITVTPAGTKEAAIETGMITLVAGGIYTAVAVNGSNDGDAPQLILQDDFISE